MHAILRLLAIWALTGQILATPIAHRSDISGYNQTVDAKDSAFGGLLYDDEEDTELFDYGNELGDDHENVDEDEDDELRPGDFDDFIASNRSAVLSNRLSTRKLKPKPKPVAAEVDCEADVGPTCSTMCFAALCHEDEHTGVRLDGGHETKAMDHRAQQHEKVEVIAVDVSKRAKQPKVQLTKVRVLAGSQRRGSAIDHMKAAGLIVDGEDGHGNKYAKKGDSDLDKLSPDEWPPASSMQGGLRAIIHMVPLYAQKAQSSRVRAMWKNGGFMLVKNWKKNAVCVAFNSNTKSECKSNKAFGSLDYQVPAGKNKFYQSGNMPASAPTNEKMADIVKQAKAQGAIMAKNGSGGSGGSGGAGGSGKKRPHPKTGNSQAHLPTRPKTKQPQSQTSGGQGQTSGGQGHKSGGQGQSSGGQGQTSGGQRHKSGGQGQASGGQTGASGSGKGPKKAGH